MKLSDFDIFFITYDEPKKEEFWKTLKSICPKAKRTDGIEGFDAAYKECAERSCTDRFVTIDGDNSLRQSFFDEEFRLPNDAPSDCVLSYSAYNKLNGLAYGNGSVKCWPKETVLKKKTHESASSGRDTIDFYWSLNYYMMPSILSDIFVTDTPYQAFRAGFREGVKLDSVT